MDMGDCRLKKPHLHRRSKLESGSPASVGSMMFTAPSFTVAEKHNPALTDNEQKIEGGACTWWGVPCLTNGKSLHL